MRAGLPTRDDFSIDDRIPARCHTRVHVSRGLRVGVPSSPPEPRDYEERLDRIQREHPAYLGGLRDSGVIVIDVTVVDQPDETLRGLAFYRTGSLADTRALAEQDPAVLAGRLVAEAMTWWCPPGTMTRAGRAVTVPDP